MKPQHIILGVVVLGGGFLYKQYKAAMAVTGATQISFFAYVQSLLK